MPIIGLNGNSSCAQLLRDKQTKRLFVPYSWSCGGGVISSSDDNDHHGASMPLLQEKGKIRLFHFGRF